MWLELHLTLLPCVAAEVATGRRGAAAAAPPAASGMFGGLPLQTPMPFAGEAMALPITMLTQKRGGRTKAVPVPDAAIVTTAGGCAGVRLACVMHASGNSPRLLLHVLVDAFASTQSGSSVPTRACSHLLQTASSGRWVRREWRACPTATARRSQICSPRSSTSLPRRWARRCSSVAAASDEDGVAGQRSLGCAVLTVVGLSLAATCG